LSPGVAGATVASAVLLLKLFVIDASVVGTRNMAAVMAAGTSATGATPQIEDGDGTDGRLNAVEAVLVHAVNFGAGEGGNKGFRRKVRRVGDQKSAGDRVWASPLGEFSHDLAVFVWCPLRDSNARPQD
jgi:hypothetical protein